MNLCGACGEDFAGLEDFDAHRVGTHAYDFSLEHLDGRRCLAETELIEGGWLKNPRGRWLSPRNVRKRVRRGRVFAASRRSRQKAEARVGGA